MKDERGFTFVELSIAIAILAILVFLAIANYMIAVHKTQDISCQANLKIIRKAIDQYYVNNGEYPDSLEDLKPDYLREDFQLKCPRSKQAYEYDSNTHEVKCPYSSHSDY